MYPCSNVELVAAASESGALGVIQPLTLRFVHGTGLKDGITEIRKLTSKPLALNVLTEKSAKIYQKRMEESVDIALEAGIRFFVTYLGKPGWVVRKVQSLGGIVYHDVTRRSHAQRALEEGVHGLICVNGTAGGHAGDLNLEELWADLDGLKVPKVAAGGISTREGYQKALKLGYDAVQMGTRFIATNECSANPDYKKAILEAHAKDIVKTWRVTGVPLAVIKTPYVESIGTEAGFFARWMLKGRKTKHWVRLFYSLMSLVRLRKMARPGQVSSKDLFQAGQSVEGINRVISVKEVVRDLTGS